MLLPVSVPIGCCGINLRHDGHDSIAWFSAMVMLGSVCQYTVPLWDYNIERIWICPDNCFGQDCDDG